MKKRKNKKYKKTSKCAKRYDSSLATVNKKSATTVWLRNKRYKLIKTHALPRDSWGLCTDPAFAKREIKIHKKLKGAKELEIIIHEMLHACFWDIDEKVIKEVGGDISKALWKMGYRK
jgi:hypothetical protein